MPEEKLTAPKQDAKTGDEALTERVRQLEAALASSRAALPLSLIPEHGAGPGMEVRETWSQAEQEELSLTVPPH